MLCKSDSKSRPNFTILVKRLNNAVEQVTSFAEKSSLTSRSIVFVDGLITKSVFYGSTTIMNNIDRMHKALVERLNDLLDVDRAFLFSEDPFLGRVNLEIPDDHHVFATVNTQGKPSIQ